MLSKKLMVSATIFLTTPFLAQAAGTEDITARIMQLEQEIATLKLEVEKSKKETNQKIESMPNVTLSEKGLSVQSADKNFQMKVTGFIQADSRTSLNGNEDASNDQFLLRRVRPTLEGSVYNRYSYRIMPDFGNGKTNISDAYLGAIINPSATIHIGKFKPPVGIEQTQSSTNGAFAERGLPSSLLPSRDVGIRISGTILDKKLGYQAGVFNGTIDGGNSDLESDDHKEVLLRLFATPFIDSNQSYFQKIGIGIGGTYGEKDGSTSNTQLATYKSPAQTTVFRYRTETNIAVADGIHKRLTPQAYYYLNSFGMLAEYVVSSQEIRVNNIKETLDNRAWGITASYVLTGEDASYNSIKPATAFDFDKGLWGAVELVGRYGELEIDDNAFPLFADPSLSAQKITEIGTGLNWYLNESVKLMLSYNFTTFKGGAENNTNREDEQTLFTRVQYRF